MRYKLTLDDIGLCEPIVSCWDKSLDFKKLFRSGEHAIEDNSNKDPIFLSKKKAACVSSNKAKL